MIATSTGDAPTTFEWSTISLPTKVRLILETWRYLQSTILFPTLVDVWCDIFNRSVLLWSLSHDYI